MLNNQKGMTLVEIMIVVALIVGLMAVLGKTIFGSADNAKVSQAKIQMGEISKALEMYNQACNSYPSTDLGLTALTQSPGEACPNWGPEAYMKKVPKDPWGSEFIYENDGANFVLISLGKDKREGGEGAAKDISSADLN